VLSATRLPGPAAPSPAGARHEHRLGLPRFGSSPLGSGDLVDPRVSRSHRRPRARAATGPVDDGIRRLGPPLPRQRRAVTPLPLPVHGAHLRCWCSGDCPTGGRRHRVLVGLDRRLRLCRSRRRARAGASTRRAELARVLLEG
jgi:hypothetical protein